MTKRLRLFIIGTFFLSILIAQFESIKITIDDRLLRSEEKQSIFNLKNDIKNFFLSTEWNETYNDLNISLHIQLVFEGLTQKGNQSIFSSQALFSNGEDLRYFDKSVQF